MSLRHQAAAGVRWTGLATAVAAVVQFAQLALLARLLSPSDFGLMGMTLVVVGVVQVFADAGVSAALVHRREVSREQLSSLYWLNVVAGFVLYGAVVASVPLVVALFSEPRLARIVPLAGVVLVTGTFGAQFQVLLQKELRFDLLTRVSVAAVTAGAVVSVALAASGAGVWSLVWGALAQGSLSSLLLAGYGWRRWRPSLRFSLAEIRSFLGFGAYQMGERAVNALSARMDQILLGSLLGAQALGLYTFALELVMQPSVRVNQVVTQVAFPVFAKVQHDPERLRRGYLHVLRLVTTVNAPVLVGLAAVAPVAVPWLFGAAWVRAVPLVQLLAVYALIRSTGNPVGSLLLARGRADLGFRWNLGLLLLVGPAVYAGYLLGGLTGVALANVVLQAVLASAGYLLLVRPLVGRCAADYAGAIVKPALLAAAMGLVVALAAAALRRPGTPDGGLLAGQVLTGVVTYALLVWLLDRPMLRDIGALLRAPASGAAA